MNKYITTAYNVLYNIYIGGEYVQQALNKVDDIVMPNVTKMVYGVLENDVRLSYYISKSFKKNPDNKTTLVIKLGMFIIDNMDSIPDYAAINECVELIEIIGKKQLKGFINVALKNYADKKIPLPVGKFESMSVEYSVPIWLVKAYCKQYGEETARKIMKRCDTACEHIRANTVKLTHKELAEILKKRNIEYKESLLGYYVRNSRAIRDLFDLGMITIQSLSSMLVVKALGVMGNCEVLDLCSAPGGKAILISELAPEAKITACELYEHRIELIKTYIKRMEAHHISVIQNDATVKKDEFIACFNYVLCDVPCSGLGVAHKKPDIYLRKTMEGILELSELQYKILNNAIEYAADGGIIVYSTCTTLREENYNVIGRTLKNRRDVVLEKMDIPYDNNGFIQLLPDENTDGFFIAKLKKIKSN